jgi:hypothetical protein
VDDVIQFYEKIGSAEEVNVQVKRRGRLQDIKFQVQE